jgi:JAB1/Mov34/MPN/PAD-1 ubiquitin protease
MTKCEMLTNEGQEPECERKYATRVEQSQLLLISMVATTTEQVSLFPFTLIPLVDSIKADSPCRNHRRCVRQTFLLAGIDDQNYDISVVHPLVLLSVADHHARSVARSSSKRVVGVLLGQDHGRSINVANSFGVPFEEDDKDAKTWFLDHNYVESMFEMFKKVNGAFHASFYSLLSLERS